MIDNDIKVLNKKHITDELDGGFDAIVEEKVVPNQYKSGIDDKNE